MFQNYGKRVQTNHTLHMFSIFWLCSDCIADLIKKLELRLTAVSALLKIRFGHAQITVPKISILMPKAATSIKISINKNRVVMVSKGDSF